MCDLFKLQNAYCWLRKSLVEFFSFYRSPEQYLPRHIGIQKMLRLLSNQQNVCPVCHTRNSIEMTEHDDRL